MAKKKKSARKLAKTKSKKVRENIVGTIGPPKKKK